ncbi:MAG: crossover junction endodeoxyribonuclease RuvC [Actinomycetota bacterium]
MVIGIDPGLASTGYALVRRDGSRLVTVACGTLRTSPRTPHADRLRALHDGVAALIDREGVVDAAIESWFVHPPSRTAMGMAEARGAILVALAGRGLAVAEYAPNEVKQAVTGNGRAEKQQVRAMVARLASGPSAETDHAADALAIAICHLNRSALADAVRRAL